MSLARRSGESFPDHLGRIESALNARSIDELTYSMLIDVAIAENERIRLDETPTVPAAETRTINDRFVRLFLSVTEALLIYSFACDTDYL